MSLKKNVASQHWRVFAWDVTTNLPKTGDAANISAKIAKDGAAAAVTNDINPTETEDGYYNFNLLQAETNADMLDLFPESSTANIQVIGVPGSRSTVYTGFSDGTMNLVNTVTTLTNLPAITANWLTAAGIAASALDGKGDWNIGKTGYALSSAGLDSILQSAPGMVEIAKAVWDRVISKANHDISQSGGKVLRNLAGSILFEGMATAGAASSITLPAGGNANNDFYRFATVIIIGGTGDKQERSIISYDGTTKVARVTPQWVVNPDATSEIEILPGLVHAAGTNQDLSTGHAVAATATTITLNGSASIIDTFYEETLISIHTGTGAGQSRNVEGYVGATKVLTIDRAWDTIPDVTSEYVITQTITAPHIADHVLDELLAGHSTIGSLGKAISDIEVDAAAIKVQTDKMLFTIANQIDANVQYVNDILVIGTGALGDEWRPTP